VLTIIGAVPYFSGVFTSKKTNQVESGYYKMLFKISDIKERDIIVNKKVVTIRQNIIVATSGKRIASFFAQMCEQYGFFDWPEGCFSTVIIQKDSETNEEEIIPIDPSMLEDN
jgi:hypothetical protein